MSLPFLHIMVQNQHKKGTFIKTVLGIGAANDEKYYFIVKRYKTTRQP
jgi:hypothetical protein